MLFVDFKQAFVSIKIIKLPLARQKLGVSKKLWRVNNNDDARNKN